MMNKINFIRLGFVIGIGIALFFGLSSVSANTLAETTAGYGYTQEYGGSVSSRVWVPFSSSNLLKYNYDLPHSSAIDIDEFNVRMRVTNGFSRGSNYLITFKWANYDSDNSTFLVYYNRMIHLLSCYASSWSSTAQSGTSCFTSYNISAVEGSNSAIVLVTISITPSNDFYGLVLRNYHDNDPYSSYVSEGWELYDFDYVFSESGTSEIINNATQNTQNIINNQDSNTQHIIDNQNQNSQDIQNTINDNFQSCRDSKNLYDLTNGEVGNILSDGTLTGNTESWRNKNYISVSSDTNYTFSLTNRNTNYILRVAEYDSNYSILSRNQISSYPYTFTTSSSTKFIKTIVYLPNTTMSQSIINDIKPQIEKGSTPTSYEPFGEICTNKIDDTNQAINNLNDSLTDNTPPDTNSLSNAAGWLPAGPVDSILNLPLTLLQSLNNTLSTNSCQPLTINLPHLRTPLVIPCMTAIWEGFGLLSFFTWVGRVLGGILLYKYLVNLYKWVDDTLTLREKNNFDDGSLG